MRNKLRDKPWYSYTIAACIAVTLYVVLDNLGSITAGIKTFFGYFEVILIACVLAYIMNPLAALIQRKVFSKVKQPRFSWNLSIAATILILLLFVSFVLRIMIPQLADSVVNLINNMDGYIASLQEFIRNLGFNDTDYINQLISSSGDILARIQQMIIDNVNDIVEASAEAGKGIAKWVIAFVLSVYLLSAKKSIKANLLRIMHAIVPEKRFNHIISFLTRCDKILVRYILYSLLDAIIVGTLNAIFMAFTGMQYIGLISLIVAVTNLIPTFGPIIGGTIGAFILLLVKPVHALIFIIFTFILQFIDPYVIKPKLFGNSLGVSGLLILISVVVFGNMFGVMGILFSIPIAAIIDFVYRDAFIPYLEKRRAIADKKNLQED